MRLRLVRADTEALGVPAACPAAVSCFCSGSNSCASGAEIAAQQGLCPVPGGWQPRCGDRVCGGEPRGNLGAVRAVPAVPTSFTR